VKTSTFPVRRQSGFSLVELMVGMVIGLIAIVVMFQVFAVTESQRRTTTGAGDAQQNGSTALFIMERDVRMAGYGFQYWPLLGCKSHGFYRKTGTAFDFTLAPVVVVDGNANGPDTITFTYGNPDTYALPSALANPTNVTPGYIQVLATRMQFRPGDVMLSAEVPAAGAMKDCWVTQVTDLSDTYLDRISVGGGTYVDNGVTHTAEYSLPFAMPVTYAKWNPTKAFGGRLFDLGPQPVSMTYSIVNNQLVATNAFDGVATPVADNIVQFQVQLGYSPKCQTSGLDSQCMIGSTAPVVATIDGTPFPNPYTLPHPGIWGDKLVANPTAVDYRRVVAVRMAIVARSSAPDKKDTLGNCTATTVQPVWASNNNSTLFVDSNSDWRCYRYKVFELTMPLRNMLWFADPDGTPVPPSGL
jgi:type IV pilus assembly protein PilW